MSIEEEARRLADSIRDSQVRMRQVTRELTIQKRNMEDCQIEKSMIRDTLANITRLEQDNLGVFPPHRSSSSLRTVWFQSLCLRVEAREITMINTE